MQRCGSSPAEAIGGLTSHHILFIFRHNVFHVFINNLSFGSLSFHLFWLTKLTEIRTFCWKVCKFLEFDIRSEVVTLTLKRQDEGWEDRWLLKIAQTDHSELNGWLDRRWFFFHASSTFQFTVPALSLFFFWCVLELDAPALSLTFLLLSTCLLSHTFLLIRKSLRKS